MYTFACCCYIFDNSGTRAGYVYPNKDNEAGQDSLLSSKGCYACSSWHSSIYCTLFVLPGRPYSYARYRVMVCGNTVGSRPYVKPLPCYYSRLCNYVPNFQDCLLYNNDFVYNLSVLSALKGTCYLLNLWDKYGSFSNPLLQDLSRLHLCIV